MSQSIKKILTAIENDPTVKGLVSTASDIKQKRGFLDFLEDVLSMPSSQIQPLIRDSYYHKNGFSKLVLAGKELGPRIRIHYWNIKNATQPFHSHTWNFSAIVLKGSLKIEEASICNFGGDLKLYNVPNRAARTNGATVFCETSNALIIERSPKIVENGNLHSLAVKKFHSVSCLTKEGAISLVLQGPHESQCSKILMDSYVKLHDPYEVKYFSMKSYTNELREILEILETQYG